MAAGVALAVTGRMLRHPIVLAALPVFAACTTETETLRAHTDDVVVEMNESAEVAVLANDDNVPDDPELNISTLPSHGSAKFEGGLLIYTPSDDYIGDDVLEYEVIDNV